MSLEIDTNGDIIADIALPNMCGTKVFFKTISYFQGRILRFMPWTNWGKKHQNTVMFTETGIEIMYEEGIFCSSSLIYLFEEFLVIFIEAKVGCAKNVEIRRSSSNNDRRKLLILTYENIYTPEFFELREYLGFKGHNYDIPYSHMDFVNDDHYTIFKGIEEIGKKFVLGMLDAQNEAIIELRKSQLATTLTYYCPKADSESKSFLSRIYDENKDAKEFFSNESNESFFNTACSEAKKMMTEKELDEALFCWENDQKKRFNHIDVQPDDSSIEAPAIGKCINNCTMTLIKEYFQKKSFKKRESELSSLNERMETAIKKNREKLASFDITIPAKILSSVNGVKGNVVKKPLTQIYKKKGNSIAHFFDGAKILAERQSKKFMMPKVSEDSNKFRIKLVEGKKVRQELIKVREQRATNIQKAIDRLGVNIDFRRIDTKEALKIKEQLKKLKKKEKAKLVKKKRKIQRRSEITVEGLSLLECK